MTRARTPLDRLRRRARRRLTRYGRAIGLALGIVPRPVRERPDLLFGLAAIARHLGIGKHQVRTLVTRQAIPAFQLDGVTCARRSSLTRRFAELERTPNPKM